MAGVQEKKVEAATTPNGMEVDQQTTSVKRTEQQEQQQPVRPGEVARQEEGPRSEEVVVVEDGWRTRRETRDHVDEKTGNKVREERVDRERDDPEGTGKEHHRTTVREEEGDGYRTVSRVETYTLTRGITKKARAVDEKEEKKEEKKEEEKEKEKEEENEEGKKKEKEEEKKESPAKERKDVGDSSNKKKQNDTTTTAETAKGRSVVRTDDGWTTKRSQRDHVDEKTGAKVHEEHVERERQAAEGGTEQHRTTVRDEKGDGYRKVSRSDTLLWTRDTGKAERTAKKERTIPLERSTGAVSRPADTAATKAEQQRSSSDRTAVTRPPAATVVDEDGWKTRREVHDGVDAKTGARVHEVRVDRERGAEQHETRRRDVRGEGYHSVSHVERYSNRNPPRDVLWSTDPFTLLDDSLDLFPRLATDPFTLLDDSLSLFPRLVRRDPFFAALPRRSLVSPLMDSFVQPRFSVILG